MSTPTSAPRQEKRSRDETSTYEIDIKRLDGEIRHVQLTAAPQYGGMGMFAGALTTLQDVTELTQLKRALDEERVQLLTLVNNLPDAVYLKTPGFSDCDGRQKNTQRFMINASPSPAQSPTTDARAIGLALTFV